MAFRWLRKCRCGKNRLFEEPSTTEENYVYCDWLGRRREFRVFESSIFECCTTWFIKKIKKLPWDGKYFPKKPDSGDERFLEPHGKTKFKLWRKLVGRRFKCQQCGKKTFLPEDAEIRTSRFDDIAGFLYFYFFSKCCCGINKVEKIDVRSTAFLF